MRTRRRVAESPPPAVPTAPSTASAGDSERETAAIELLWDLVFVFAVTQVTTLLAHDPGWARLGQAMLVLALVWWSWSAFVWASDAHDAESLVLRGHLLVAMVLIFIVGLAVPHAFRADGLAFACAYAAARLVHLSLYASASRRGQASWTAIAGFGVTVLIGMALLIAGALLGGWSRIALWTAAVVIDYAGPAGIYRARLRSLQRVGVAHFADRFGGFVIICLGESVLSIGVGVSGAHHLTPELLVIASVGLLVAVGMWWTYFDRVARAAQARLRQHGDPVVAAADAFSYLHLVIIAGIIIYAAGIQLIVHGTLGAPIPGPGRLAFCAGVALYLVGVSAFRLRMLGEHSVARLAVAVAVIVVYAVSGGLPAWAVTVIVAVLIGVLCAVESVTPAPSDPTTTDPTPTAPSRPGSGDPAPPAPAPRPARTARAADPEGPGAA